MAALAWQGLEQMVERRRRERCLGERLYRLLHDGWIALVQRFQGGAVGDLWKEERLEVADRTHRVHGFDRVSLRQRMLRRP